MARRASTKKAARPRSSEARGRRKPTEFEQSVAELAARMARSPGRWPLRKAKRQFEQHYVFHVLEKVEGDRQKATRMLGISLASLKEKIRDDWMKR